MSNCSHMRRSPLVVAALASALVACTMIIPGTMAHDLTRDAAEQERKRCDPDPVDPRLFGRDVIESEAPYYRYAMGGPNGREAHVAGVELELRPLPGVTAELLERGLLCRSAQLMLGHASPLPNEPYYLPGAWVTVDVRSGGGSLAVRVAAEDDEHGREILARAKAFLARPDGGP